MQRRKMTKKKMESRRGTTRYTRLAPREQFNSLRTVLNRGGAVSSTVQVFIQTTILSCLRGAGSVRYLRWHIREKIGKCPGGVRRVFVFLVGHHRFGYLVRLNTVGVPETSFFDGA